MKPIAPQFLSQTFEVQPGDRLHRLFARLADTYYDDLSEDRIEELERKVDEWRWMHADASRFTA
jgi:hypothetical protein